MNKNTKFSVEVTQSAEYVWDNIVLRGTLLDKWDGIRWGDLPEFERRQMFDLVSGVRSAVDMLDNDLQKMSKEDRISFYRPSLSRRWFAYYPVRITGSIIWLKWVWKIPGGYVEILV